MSADLATLLERVRKASGPSQELDAIVRCALIAPAGSKAEKSPHNGMWCVYEPKTYGKEPFGLWEDRFPGARQQMEIGSSIDAAVALVRRVLPGWWITSGLCALTGHASIGPDYNGPDRERLLKQFPEYQFDAGFDADLAPGDGVHRQCLAIIDALLQAKIAEAALLSALDTGSGR